MKGTSGSPDYVIIAKNGDVVLGVRGLLIDGGAFGWAVGIRVRTGAYQGGDAGHELGKNVESLGANSEEPLRGAWPDIEFSKTSDLRASVVIGHRFAAADFNVLVDQGKIKENSVVVNLLSWLLTRVPAAYRVAPPEVIIEHLTSQVNHAISEHVPISALFVEVLDESSPPGIKDYKEVSSHQDTHPCSPDNDEPPVV